MRKGDLVGIQMEGLDIMIRIEQIEIELSDSENIWDKTKVTLTGELVEEKK